MQIAINKLSEYFTYFSLGLLSACVGSCIGYNGIPNVPWIGLIFSFLLLLGAVILYKKSPFLFDLEFFSKLTISILIGLYTFLYFQTEDYTRKYFELFKLPCLVFLVSNFFLLVFVKKNGKASIWHTAVILIAKNPGFYFCFPIFFLLIYTPQIFSAGDTTPAKLYPFTLFSEGNLDLNEFFPPFKLIKASEFANTGEILDLFTKLPSGDYLLHPFYLVWTNEKILGSYPVIPGIINSVVYGLIRIVGINLPMPTEISDLHPIPFYIFYLEKYTAAAIATLTSLFFFRAASKICSLRTALTITILYTFGSNHLSTGSQTLWQHGFIELLSALSLPFLLSSKQLSSQRSAWLGLLLATFYFVRPTAIIIAFFICIIFCINLISSKQKDKFRPLFWIGLSAIAATLIFGAINYYLYKTFEGGYALLRADLQTSGVTSLFGGKLLDGLSGLLLSPGFGLFVYTPLTILSFTGPFIANIRKKRLFFLILICCITYLLFYSLYFVWWGGKCYGSRFLSDLGPFFFLLLIPSFKFVKQIGILRILFVLFAIISVWAHSSAVYKEKLFNDWFACNHLPIGEKIWDWNRIPYTHPFRKYYPLVTGKLDIDPIFECHFGKFSRRIDDRSAFFFNESPSGLRDSYGNDKLIPDVTTYLRKGNHCLQVYGASTDKKAQEIENLKIIITQGKNEIFSQKYALPAISSEEIPNFSEFQNPTIGKIKISIIRLNDKPIEFSLLRIEQGSCTDPEKR